MADIVIAQGTSIPQDTRVRYRDMLDGTHSLVVFDGSSGLGVVRYVDVTDRAARDLGLVRVLATYDGTTYVAPRLDASTWATTTIEYPHHEI